MECLHFRYWKTKSAFDDNAGNTSTLYRGNFVLLQALWYSIKIFWLSGNISSDSKNYFSPSGLIKNSWDNLRLVGERVFKSYTYIYSQIGDYSISLYKILLYITIIL